MGHRVEFLICGTQKGGTTALAEYLRMHPGLYIPKEKELHFFDDESQDWQNPSLDHYHGMFEQSHDNQIWGEATPIYMYWEEAAKRIWNYNSDMRIILTLRNPITRAFSHWAMEQQRGAETLGFEQALLEEEQRCRKALPFQHRVFSYQDRGFYCHQIRRLWHFFGKDAVLIIKQEALRSAAQECINLICRHLGVGEIEVTDQLECHRRTYQESMNKQCIQKLVRQFEQEIRQLEVMLDWDCSDWLAIN